MRLLLAFLLYPIVEIALLIQVGGLIGLWPTLAVVVLTAVLGGYLIRRQGLGAMAALRGSAAALGDPGRPLLDGAAILLAGVLLLLPGLLSDAVGLLLLLPPIRRAIFGALRQRVHVAGRFARHSAQGEVVEGDYSVIDPAAPHLPSRH